MDVRVFDRTGMSCRKNSQEEFLTALALAPKGVASKDGGHKNPAGGTNPDRVCAFFWLLFFAQAKKSNSLKERKLWTLILSF